VKAGVDVAAADAGMPSSDVGEADWWKMVEEGKKWGSGRPLCTIDGSKKIFEFKLDFRTGKIEERYGKIKLNEADRRPDMAE